MGIIFMGIIYKAKESTHMWHWKGIQTQGLLGCDNKATRQTMTVNKYLNMGRWGQAAPGPASSQGAGVAKDATWNTVHTQIKKMSPYI